MASVALKYRRAEAKSKSKAKLVYSWADRVQIWACGSRLNGREVTTRRPTICGRRHQTRIFAMPGAKCRSVVAGAFHEAKRRNAFVEHSEA